MPRLGEDPNIASAYPTRRTLSSGGWLRQFVTAALGSLFIFFIFNKVFLTNYREATKYHMGTRGFDEDRIAKMVPKTKSEKVLEQKLAAEAKKSNSKKIVALQEEVGNLTLSVWELQQARVNSTGVILKHPVVLPNTTLDATEGGGVEDGAPTVAGGGDAEASNAHRGDSRQLMVKGENKLTWRQRQLRGRKGQGRKHDLGLAQQAP